MRLLAIAPALAAVVLLATAPAPAAAPAASGELAFWRKCGTGCGDLYLRSARGEVRRLTRTNAAFAPSWSPDGRSIAFVRARLDRAGSHALYVLDLRRGAARRVAAPANPDSAPAWSPDSRLLAFSSDERLELVRPDGTGRRTLAVGADPAWSPDGRELAYGDGSAVLAVEVGTGKPRTVVRGGADPSWSADGRIAFTVQLPVGSTGLDAVSADGSGRRVLTRPGNLRHDQAPAWRP